MSNVLAISEGSVSKAKSRLGYKLGLDDASQTPSYLSDFIDKYC